MSSQSPPEGSRHGDEPPGQSTTAEALLAACSDVAELSAELATIDVPKPLRDSVKTLLGAALAHVLDLIVERLTRDHPGLDGPIDHVLGDVSGLLRQDGDFLAHLGATHLGRRLHTLDRWFHLSRPLRTRPAPVQVDVPSVDQVLPAILERPDLIGHFHGQDPVPAPDQADAQPSSTDSPSVPQGPGSAGGETSPKTTNSNGRE